jgi:hypothetical protein
MTPRICTICGASWTPATAGSQRPHLYCSHGCRGLGKSRSVHPDLDERFFATIDTREKAYWLGFLYADGGVSDGRNRLRLHLHLSAKDEDQLDRFIETVGLNPASKHHKVHRGHRSTGIYTGNRLFVGHLVDQGCVPRKTLVIRHPHLADRALDLAFLLGYFDGDGTISGRVIKLACGSSGFLVDVKERQALGYKITHTEPNCFQLYLGRSLYENMLDNYTASMPRKRVSVPNNTSPIITGVVARV